SRPRDTWALGTWTLGEEQPQQRGDRVLRRGRPAASGAGAARVRHRPNAAGPAPGLPAPRPGPGGVPSGGVGRLPAVGARRRTVVPQVIRAERGPRLPRAPRPAPTVRGPAGSWGGPRRGLPPSPGRPRRSAA